MKRLQSREDLACWRQNCEERIAGIKCRILICAGTGCLAGGSEKIYEKMCSLCRTDPDTEIVFGPEAAHDHSDIDVQKSGCHGFCEMGPLVRIEPYNYLYIKVKPEDCEEIYNTTVKNGKPVERLLYSMDGVTYPAQEDIPFYAKQMRLVLKNCGRIGAEHIEEALAFDGYKALEKALFEMKPEEVTPSP